MKITIVQDAVREPELYLHCKDPDSPEVQAILCRLNGTEKMLSAQQAEEITLLKPSEVLYGEFVGRGVFLYTEQQVLSTTRSLAQLEADYPDFVRCSKSMVVNLQGIRSLRSELHGRIMATLQNGERILISRHYAATLRERLMLKNNLK